MSNFGHYIYLTPHQKLQSLASDYGVLDFCSIILDDPRFPIWAGASKPHQHHYRKGGLAEHTLEVVELCLRNNGFFPENKQSEPRQLFLAGLFHDAGKMWDYEPVAGTDYAEWQGTHHKRHIHHISRSALVWTSAWDRQPLPDTREGYNDEVLHAILAHHGLREWGSPVSPNTRLAWMLHLCDGISARMDDADKWDQRA